MGAYADLHVHTTASDGTLTLGTLPDAARRAGVRAVAVTDHDRVHPDLDAAVVELDGVTVVRGVELRVHTPGERVDLLGYGVDPTPALADELDRLQANRTERARAMVDCIDDRLGVTLDLDIGPGVGRPHVARAVVDHPDTDYATTGAVFDDLIGAERPCYVARELPGFERGRELLGESCALVGLAHPLRYADPAGALSLAAELDAVERDYPYGGPVDLGPVDRTIAAYDLVATGGSDAHGVEVGATGLDAAGFERFEAALDASA